MRPCKIGRRTVQVEIDNSWVVPYSPFLSRKFNCHLNVELCVSRVGGIKYLFKYVCKGRDRVTVEFVNETARYDEISSYQDARYINASEAVWRLMGFTYILREPPVVRLDCHLEGHHTVYFKKGGEDQAGENDRPATKLMEWFNVNRDYPSARRLRYNEVEKYFTWAPGKIWKPRARFKIPPSERGGTIQYDFSEEHSSKATFVVSRIYTVSPREGERYYLRMLLHHVQGATRIFELWMGRNAQALERRALNVDYFRMMWSGNGHWMRRFGPTSSR